MLKLKELTKDFGGLRAVDHVNFEVKEGILTSLIGPNGSGKSTVFNMISGVLIPNAGSIHWKDKKIDGLRSHKILRMGIGRTFQELRIFGNLTVIENVMVGFRSMNKWGMLGSILRLPGERKERRILREKAEALLALLGIVDKSNRMPDSLPYAEQRMIDVARALAHEPKVVLLDEPAAGMNPKEKKVLSETLIKINKELCNTIFLIEHDMSFVMSLSDHIGVLNFGRLIAEGVPEEIQNNDDVIKAYLGEPE